MPGEAGMEDSSLASRACGPVREGEGSGGRGRAQLEADETGVLWTEFQSSLGGAALIRTMQALVVRHFSLASTTVTSIPMKEEQTSGQSANYDVELLHHRSGHADLERLGLLSGPDSLLVPGPAGYRTLTLKWSSPNAKMGLSADGLFVCSSVSPVTPSAVNSRPSACLTSFLLSGRTVMLEVPRKSGQAPIAGLSTFGQGNKPISHLLTCHGGHIFLHALSQGRSAAEDPPSISEGPGGKVGDYRISAVADLIREHQLTPSSDDGLANRQARLHLRLGTKHWPLTFADSLLASLVQTPSAVSAWLGPVLATNRKAKLSDADAALVRDGLFRLMAMHSAHEALPSHALAATKLKGLKKEEQYRLLFAEVETWLRTQSFRSLQHLSNLNVWLHLFAKPVLSGPLGGVRPPLRCEEWEQEVGTEGHRAEAEAALVAEERAETEVPEEGELSPALATAEAGKAPRPRAAVLPGTRKRTLLDLYAEADAARWAGWQDLTGRLRSQPGQPALLYQVPPTLTFSAIPPSLLFQHLLKRDEELRRHQVEMETS